MGVIISFNLLPVGRFMAGAEVSASRGLTGSQGFEVRLSPKSQNPDRKLADRHQPVAEDLKTRKFSSVHERTL